MCATAGRYAKGGSPTSPAAAGKIVCRFLFYRRSGSPAPQRYPGRPLLTACRDFRFSGGHLVPPWALAILGRLNYRHWLALVFLGAVLTLLWSDRAHETLAAQIRGKADTASVSQQLRSLERKVDAVGADVDSMNVRLRQLLCEQKPRWCR
jgi:hypothetical protein